MAEPPFDLKKGHRWFAVELNNLGWEYVEAESRTDDEVERMIHAAHGACFHWLQVGDLLHHLRAQCLIVSAYCAAGLSEPAMRHAEKCLALSAQASDTQSKFDLACVHGCAALAYAQGGATKQAEEQRDALDKACTKLESQDEIQLIERLYRIPLTTGRPRPLN